MLRALCAHNQEVKVVLYSIWYHHTCRWPSGAQVEKRLKGDIKSSNRVFCHITTGCHNPEEKDNNLEYFLKNRLTKYIVAIAVYVLIFYCMYLFIIYLLTWVLISP